jgi:molecular chaperone GrpE
MANGDETPQTDPTAAEPSAVVPDDHAEPAPDQSAQEGVTTPVPDQDPAPEPEAEAEADQDPDPEPDPLADAERQRDEYLDHLRRERAEFENFRRRSARERADALDRGAELLVSKLIGVLDNFGFVLAAAQDSPDDGLAKGAQMVYAELVDVLRKAGLEEIKGAGEPFDPTHHEAMLEVPADEPVAHPTVAEVLRAGYRFKDRVLRPASVSVQQ